MSCALPPVASKSASACSAAPSAVAAVLPAATAVTNAGARAATAGYGDSLEGDPLRERLELLAEDGPLEPARHLVAEVDLVRRRLAVVLERGEERVVERVDEIVERVVRRRRRAPRLGERDGERDARGARRRPRGLERVVLRCERRERGRLELALGERHLVEDVVEGRVGGEDGGCHGGETYPSGAGVTRRRGGRARFERGPPPARGERSGHGARRPGRGGNGPDTVPAAKEPAGFRRTRCPRRRGPADCRRTRCTRRNGPAGFRRARCTRRNGPPVFAEHGARGETAPPVFAEHGARGETARRFSPSTVHAAKRPAGRGRRRSSRRSRRHRPTPARSRRARAALADMESWPGPGTCLARAGVSTPRGAAPRAAPRRAPPRPCVASGLLIACEAEPRHRAQRGRGVGCLAGGCSPGARLAVMKPFSARIRVEDMFMQTKKRHRDHRRAGGVGGRAAALSLGVAAALAAASSPAAAQQPPIALEQFDPAPAGDRMFGVPSPTRWARSRLT